MHIYAICVKIRIHFINYLGTMYFGQINFIGFVFSGTESHISEAGLELLNLLPPLPSAIAIGV